MPSSALPPPHIQNRVRAALFIQLTAAVYGKAHVPVKTGCRRVLLVHGQLTHAVLLHAKAQQAGTKALAARLRVQKEHFQPVLLHAHKADRCAAFILRNNQVFFSPAQGLRNISTDSGNFRRRQKQVGCLHRALPYLHQLLDQLRGSGRNFGYFHGDILSFVLCSKSCNNKQRGAARQPPLLVII